MFFKSTNYRRTSPRREPGLFPPRVTKPLAGASGCLDDRRGSTLLIVMVLLGMLTVLGFLFYTFAAQERSTATYFADANKVYSADLDADALFNFGLEQLIVGPNSDVLPQSALAGGIPKTAPAYGPHALLTNIFGWDVVPYNGSGINLGAYNAALGINGQPFVDMDFDGNPDAAGTNTPLGQAPLQINGSAAANGGTDPRNMNDPTNASNANPYQAWPDPGVNYTYPDINNLFLAYNGTAIDDYGNPVQVIIPSFHRPQLLRTGGGMPATDWDMNSAYAGQVLRPHPDHLNPNGSHRFPDAASLPIGQITTAFPFQTATSTDRNQGVWSLSTTYTAGTTTIPAYEYDVDNDKDGTFEGIWLDLGYPMQTDPSGQNYVPLYSFTVYDADSLLNLNAHGNLARINQLIHQLGISQIGDLTNTSITRLLSASNQGLAPTEINPQYALNADPSGYTGDDYQLEFGNNPASVLQASNMDWYRLLTGAAKFTDATHFNDLYAGRYGEASTVLYSAFQQGIANGSASATPLNQMPFPGITGADDNWNQYEGEFAWEFHSGQPGLTNLSGGSPAFWLQYNASFMPQFFPSSITYYAQYPNGQPLDYNGDGSNVIDGTLTGDTPSLGKSRRLVTNNRMQFPQYVNYDNPGGTSNVSAAGTSDTTNLNSVDAAWHPDSLLGQQMLDSTGTAFYSAAGQGPSQQPPYSPQVDEEIETIVDPANASSSDTIFGLDEIPALHLSTSDQSGLSLGSRAKTLAPINMSTTTIAQRFTTSGWDRKQFGYAGQAGDANYASSLPAPDPTLAPYNPIPGYAINGDAAIRRPWEFSDLYDSNGNQNPDGKRETFPPQFGTVTPYSTTDPFRAPVRRLLSASVGNLNFAKPQQFRLSLNHLTTTDGNGNVIQRGLTPHDPALTDTPVTFGSQSQEDIARTDRQHMARDIYVMLYLLGGGLDFATQIGNPNYTSPITMTSPSPIGVVGYTGDNSPDSNGYRNLYSDRQLREMAQFAVNVVDALDPDHVMTKFEYDKNLGNGWNLDDNAYDFSADNNGAGSPAGYPPYGAANTNYNADYPEDSGERGVVFGVEAQQMTISEAMVIRSDQTNSGDNPQVTEFNDAAGYRYFTYVELRNISPNNITYNGQYRLRAVPYYYASPTGPGVTPTNKERRLTLLAGSVNSGALTMIGSAGQSDATKPGTPNHSRFQLPIGYTSGAPTFTADYAQIVPPSQTALDFDLLNDTQRQSGSFRLTNYDQSSGSTYDTITGTSGTELDITYGGSEIPGGFLNQDSIGDPSTQGSPTATTSFSVTFYLERRQYPDRPAQTFGNLSKDIDNPWVPVDRFTLTNTNSSAGSAGQMRELNFIATPTPTKSDVFNQLSNILSNERAEPLVNIPVPAIDKNAAVIGMDMVSYPAQYRQNSVGLENASSPTSFTNWQALYNRPFASPVELFSVPLFSPGNVTAWTNQVSASPFVQTENMQTVYQKVGNVPNTMTPYYLPYAAGIAAAAAFQAWPLPSSGFNATATSIRPAASGVPLAASAGGKFLEPEDYSNTQATMVSNKIPVNDNRWYRLLEFFEVPTRTHRQLGDPLYIMRQPGKLNLNTMRYTDIFAGLLDAPDVMTFNNVSTPNRQTLYTTDTTADTFEYTDPSSGTPTTMPREWWMEFLKARDGRLVVIDNPANPGNGVIRRTADNVTGLFLPGLADSTPFRGQAVVNFVNTSGAITRQSPGDVLENTLFRKLPIDLGEVNSPNVPPTDQRHLWEAGNSSDHTTNPPPTGFDATLKNRLLSKIYNNTTTRSHVFFVFMTVQFFQADNTNGATNLQIGGLINNSPTYRGFFIIDRSQPEDAYDSSTGKFTNYQALIKYRLTIQ